MDQPHNLIVTEHKYHWIRHRYREQFLFKWDECCPKVEVWDLEGCGGGPIEILYIDCAVTPDLDEALLRVLDYLDNEKAPH